MNETFDPGAIRRVVVVGGGQAGAQACQSLRQFGFGGEVVLIGEEPVLPYQRPPLSKAYMKDEMPVERLILRPEEWYAKQSIEVRLGLAVDAIDLGAKTVRVGASTESYDALILATGSRARACAVPGADLSGVFDLRTLDDVDRIKPEMLGGRKIVIIGGGYIGLEAAAVARQLGLDVTVVEREDRVLARVTSPILSEFYEEAHRSQGVEILTGAAVDRLQGEGRVGTVCLSDGRVLPADVVLVGIGILPNQELAAEAGLACDDGILVDDDARTSDPFVFAAGDCTKRPLEVYGHIGRLESVHNAIEQGKLAAAAICGKSRPPLDCPWFWSDQYDLKLQIAGLSRGYDKAVLRGSLASGRFAVFYLLEGTLIAVDAVNSPVEFLASKKLIQNKARPDPHALEDLEKPMKEVAAEALAVTGE